MTPNSEELHPVTGGVDVHLVGVVHLYRQSGSDIVALRGVDLDVGSGEMVALLGPSGMGKSTVLRLMAGLMTPSAGTVKVGPHDFGRLSAAERRALRAGEISYMVQGSGANVLPFATPLQNIWFAQHGTKVSGKSPPWTPPQLLEMLGIQDVASEPVARLPQGLKQQVSVAACVASAPRLLLADEPTAQLASEASADVVRLFQRVNETLGTTIVIVTHDPSIAAMFPRTVTIRDGRVGAEGRLGEEYAVVDGSGSIQLPPHVLEVLPPYSRVRVIDTPGGVELRKAELDE
ncbi:MAG TPA: ATP-binding cassette domain-containing protein [Acidimicrobiales bacterium]|nr:ATP-binding cassette domain-containing protein [Acidimicrobiales bacterium]